MTYQALYRKYRSKTFDEIVGQEAIIKTLKNALKQNKIAHAYLFSGPRGTGKTSIARLLAKALNCEKGIGYQCNECENCKAINTGSHPDVIEIDAASNNSVDDARSLIEKVKYSPILGRYKVYIIDEVHMMSSSAFNALLKTLEEPPSYVVFILCTTEPHKVLPTIVSRCQRYEFKKIDNKDLVKLIKSVLLKENVKASDEAINLIVELANGGARDALSLLDQIIAYSSNQIEVKDIEDIFGLTSMSEKITLIKFISKGDTLNVLNKLNQFISRNIDIDKLVNELLLIFKDVLIYQQTESLDLLSLLNEINVKDLNKIFTSEELNSLISLFMECQKEFKITNNPSFTFEVYLLKAIEIFKDINQLDLKVTKPKNVEPVSTQITKENIISEPKKESIELKNKPIIEETKAENTTNNLLKDNLIDTNAIQTNEELKDIDIFDPNKELEIEETETPKTVQNTQKVSKTQFNLPKLITTGEKYVIDENNLINILVTADKNARKDLSSSWNKIELYTDDPGSMEIARLLSDCTIFAKSDKYTILVCDYEKEETTLNNVENQDSISKFIATISNTKKSFIYTLDRKKYISLRTKYLNLNQLGKLPNKDDITKIEINKEEIPQ